MSDCLGKDVFKLGFGLMRLPHTPDGENDMPQVKEMVDRFIEAGGTYFDTAYVYDNGKSEAAFKEAVVERYPRESVTIATKLFTPADADGEMLRNEFNISLERTGAGYIDYYLLHNINEHTLPIFDREDIWGYVKDLKAKGLVRHWGFSFHDQPELLDRVLTEHPDVEFVQLQINYADMEAPNIKGRECYEIARKHNKPVVIMEPVKGGALADPIPAVKELFKAANPDLSFASWAVRFAAGMDGIITVLSGMSTLEQMEDNLSYMKDFKPLSEEEHKVIKDVLAEMEKVDSIACTNCKYCVEGCPMEIPIPQIFTARNRQLIYNQTERGQKDYENATKDKGLASACIGCGQCEAVCPQHLPIAQLLSNLAEVFEK